MPRAFTHDDGLPQSGVNDIVQRRDGYLWLGTFGGLARFDGSTFRIFRERSNEGSSTAPSDRLTGPASDRVISLFEGDRGRLWVGTQDAGLSVLDAGAFRHLPVCGGTCEVSAIAQNSDRSIWITSSAGIFRLSPEGGRAVRLGQSDRSVYNRLAIDVRGRVFVGGQDGLRIVAGSRLRRVPLPDGEESRVLMLERDGDGLLVGTERRLYRYLHDEERWTSQDVVQPTYAVRDQRGRWWVAQENRQIVREETPGEWRRVPELSGIGVTSLARDDEGNLWIGTVSSGLLRLREPLFGLLSEAQLRTSGSGRAVVADGSGGTWFGVACGALRHIADDGRMRMWPVREVLGSDCISSLLLDQSGALWIGTSTGALGRLANGVVQLKASWRDGDAIGIWQQDDGSLIVNAGTSTYALPLDFEGQVFQRRRIPALEGMRINRIVPATRGGTWFVGDRGVLRLVGGKAVERWSQREGLSSRFARALYEDRDGVLWIGTYGGGLNRIVDGRVHSYAAVNGLSDEAISCILADDLGRLWLGGNSGVTLLPAPSEAGETIESVLFVAEDGLTPSEINGGTSSPCLRDEGGRLWFSLVEGFAVLNPARIPEAKLPPPRVRIEDVVVDGTVREVFDEALRLQPLTRNLQIRYTAINLSRPGQTRFRFRLSGFDAGWVEAGQNRSIAYPSIPWGNHAFEVQARVAGGPWSPATAKLRIAHPQPWYQRPWIWTLTASIGLLVLLGGGQERVRRRATVRRSAARAAHSMPDSPPLH